LSIAGSSLPEKNSGAAASPARRAGRPADGAKRQKILEAAAQSFFDEGFAGTAIEQVAAHAGVSKVTIYNQFGDKRGLFTAAIECECEKIRGHFSLDDMPHGSIREKLTAIGAAMLTFLHRPEMIQFERRIAAETEHEPIVGAAFLEAGPWRMKQAFSAWLRHAGEAGELVMADPDLAAEQFVALCKGMGDLEHRFGVCVTDEASQRRITGAVDVFLAAYGAKPRAEKCQQ
jgi:TetR/AcrR family transcriptional regulator, mexJK operon transcriptional repressor